MCEKKSIFKSYLLKQYCWAKKGSSQTVYIKHYYNWNGGMYAIIKSGAKRGVSLFVNRQEYFFDNFDRLDGFLSKISHKQDSFMKILKRRDTSRKLRLLDI